MYKNTVVLNTNLSFLLLVLLPYHMWLPCVACFFAYIKICLRHINNIFIDLMKTMYLKKSNSLTRLWKFEAKNPHFKSHFKMGVLSLFKRSKESRELARGKQIVFALIFMPCKSSPVCLVVDQLIRQQPSPENISEHKEVTAVYSVMAAKKTHK